MLTSLRSDEIITLYNIFGTSSARTGSDCLAYKQTEIGSRHKNKKIEEDLAILRMYESYFYKYLGMLAGPLKNLSKAFPSLKACELDEHRTRIQP